MAEFDPDAYLAGKDAQFDPDAYLAAKPTVLPTPEGGDQTSITGKAARAVGEYARAMIPTSPEGYLRAAGIPTDLTDPTQIAEAMFPPLRAGIGIPIQAKARIEQIQAAEQTPAWSQERFNAGIATAADLLGLAAMAKAGTLPQLRPRQAQAAPPAEMPGQAGFTLAPSEAPQPLPEVPVPEAFQPVQPGQPIPYGPAAQPYQQPPPPAGGIAPTDMWPLSGQIPKEDIPYAGVVNPTPERVAQSEAAIADDARFQARQQAREQAAAAPEPPVEFLPPEPPAPAVVVPPAPETQFKVGDTIRWTEESNKGVKSYPTGKVTGIYREGKGMKAFYHVEGQEYPIREDLARPVSEAKEAPVQQPLIEAPKAPKQFKTRPPFDAFGSEVTPVSQHIIDNLGGVVSKSAAKSQGKHVPALYDGAPSLGHPSHNKLYNPEGVMPDVAAQSLFDAGLIEDPYVDTMWQHVEAESRAARQIAKQTTHENQMAKAVTKQDKAFFRVQNQPNVGVPQVAGRDLQIGDTVKVAGENFKVTDIDPDTFDVTLEDGTRFGVQHVADNEVIYGEHIRPEPLKLAQPESDVERIAREQAEAQSNAALQTEAEKKAQVKYGWQQKLTGTASDIGQQELGGELGGSESLFAQKPVIGLEDTLRSRGREGKPTYVTLTDGTGPWRVGEGDPIYDDGTIALTRGVEAKQSQVKQVLDENKQPIHFGRAGIERAGEGGGLPRPFKGRVLPPGAVKGSGRYKPVYQINKEAGDLTNKLAASRESGALKAEYRWRQVVGDLSKTQQDALGQYLVSERLKTVNPDHPQILSPLQTVKIERDPDIARALNRYKREVKPEIEALRKKAGLTATAAEGKGREFVSLIPTSDEMLPEVQTPVGGVALKFRAKTTRFAKYAEGNALKYDTDLRNILQESYGEVTQKANFRELYDFLARKGLARTEPTAEIQGQPAVPQVVGRAAKGENSASLPEVAFMPQQISAAIRDIMEQPPKINSTVENVLKAGQRGVTSLALTGNPAELVNHMRRQLDAVSSIPAANVPLPIRAVEGLVPYFGPRLGVAVRTLTENMSLPENQAILQDIFDAGAGSTRAFKEYQAKGWLANKLGIPLPGGRKLGLPEVQHATQKLLFGVPKGRGVVGWDLRMRVQLEKIRRAVEGNVDPQRIREFSNQIGQYTSKPNKFIEKMRGINPYAATTIPLRGTEFRQLVGGSGLKAKTIPGAIGLRAETLLRSVGGSAITFITANHLLSGKWPWENDPGHELDLNTNIKDEKGKTIYVGISKLFPTIGRPLKSLSLPEILRERHATSGKDYGVAAMTGPANTALSLINSPLLNWASVQATGYPLYLTKEPGRPPLPYDLASTHGEQPEGLMSSRFMRQTVAALTGINPVGRSFSESNLPSPLKYIERPLPGIEPFGKIFTTSYEKGGGGKVNINEVLKRMARDRQRIQHLGR